MKTLRFTGTIGAGENAAYVDMWFKTDMINDNDYLFNINQIQDGTEFQTSDSQSTHYLKFFATTFKLQKTDMGTAKQFAIDNGLGLRLYAADGTHTTLVDDSSLSE